MSRGETLADVYENYRVDPKFNHLRLPGMVLVPGEGSSRPNVFIVGEAPGATENTAGRPFVGASGKVLRSLIRDVAELPEDSYFITNTVKYRPAGNRTPVPYEVNCSVPYLRREWKALGCPSVLVGVGGTAKSALAPTLKGMLQIAGEPQPLTEGRTFWPMLHPAYGLRVPLAREDMERHWKAFGDWYRDWSKSSG